jgi:uncharacterized protein DUF3305
MSRPEPLVRIPVGVVVERRKASNPWVDFVWRPVAVLPGVPDMAPWTVLAGEADRTNFYAGVADIELYRSDTSGYRDNLATSAGQLWVALRPTDRGQPYEVMAVTADPGAGEAFSGSAAYLVETVPMPEPVRRTLDDFVAEHHVEREFSKRKRDRADPEAMARSVSPKDRR